MRRSAPAQATLHLAQGVTARSGTTERSVQPPGRISASAGLAPGGRKPPHRTSQASGSGHSHATGGLAAGSAAGTRHQWFLRKSISRVELAHLGRVAVEQLCLALLGEQATALTCRRSVAWLQRGWSASGFVGIKAILVAAALVPDGGGFFLGEADFDDALGALEAVLPGTTMRTGAPFWLGSSSPYMPKVRSVSGCMASSMHQAPRCRDQSRCSRSPRA